MIKTITFNNGESKMAAKINHPCNAPLIQLREYADERLRIKFNNWDSLGDFIEALNRHELGVSGLTSGKIFPLDKGMELTPKTSDTKNIILTLALNI